MAVFWLDESFRLPKRKDVYLFDLKLKQDIDSVFHRFFIAGCTASL